MSKTKSFFGPAQMIILTNEAIDEGQDSGKLQFARPGAFEDETEDMILPDGETINVDGNDFVAPPEIEINLDYDDNIAYY